MTDDQQPAAEAGDAPRGVQLGLQRIYLKDVSFESPRSPEVFRSGFQPQVKVDLNSGFRKVDEDTFEVLLSVTIEARDPDGDKMGFIVEVQQAGVFHVSGVEGPLLEQVLSTHCPNMLFPYARETVDALVVRGSFPPLMLAPMNFDALYAQARQQQAEGGEAPPTH